MASTVSEKSFDSSSSILYSSLCGPLTVGNFSNSASSPYRFLISVRVRRTTRSLRTLLRIFSETSLTIVRA